MQTFYDQLTSQAETTESEKSWQTKLNLLSLEQVAALRDSALEWDSWEAEEA